MNAFTDSDAEYRKDKPMWLLLIFQQCVQIFAWNLAHLLSN